MVNLNRESTYLIDILKSFYSEALTLYSVVLTAKVEDGVLSDLMFSLCIGHSGEATPSLKYFWALSNGMDFSEGDRTDLFFEILPVCTIAYQAGSFLELYNVNNSLVVGHHGKFDNTAAGAGVRTTVFWNHHTNPNITQDHTGVYRCRTDTGISNESLTIRVARKAHIHSCTFELAISFGFMSFVVRNIMIRCVVIVLFLIIYYSNCAEQELRVKIRSALKCW